MTTTNEASLVDQWTPLLWNGVGEEEPTESQPSSILPELFPELDQLFANTTADKSNRSFISNVATSHSPMAPSPTLSATSSSNSSIGDLLPALYPAAIHSTIHSAIIPPLPIPRTNPLSPVTEPVTELVTKAEMRKRKNREAARISREKKQQEVSRQEEQLQRLREENEQLKRQLEAALKENQRLRSYKASEDHMSTDVLLHRKRVRMDATPGITAKQSVTTLAAVLFSALLLMVPSWLPMDTGMGGGLLESGEYGAFGYSSSQPQSIGGRVLFARLPEFPSNVSPPDTSELAMAHSTLPDLESTMAHPTLPDRESVTANVPELSRIPKSVGVVGSSTDAAQWLIAATSERKDGGGGGGGGVEKPVVEDDATKALSLYCAGELVPLLPMPSLSPWAKTSSQSKRKEQQHERPIRVQLLAPLQADRSHSSFFSSSSSASSFTGGKILQQNESDRGTGESERMFLKMEVQVLRASIVSA